MNAVTEPDENVLADPYYGHLIAFESKRKVLADLMVEYASEKKLDDAYAFLETGDMEIIKRYGISTVFSERFIIHKSANKVKVLNSELEFAMLAKVFCNDRFVIHKVIANESVPQAE